MRRHRFYELCLIRSMRWFIKKLFWSKLYHPASANVLQQWSKGSRTLQFWITCCTRRQVWSGLQMELDCQHANNLTPSAHRPNRRQMLNLRPRGETYTRMLHSTDRKLCLLLIQPISIRAIFLKIIIINFSSIIFHKPKSNFYLEYICRLYIS